MKLIRKIAREILLKYRNKFRYCLERKIFPRIKNQKVLIVGCAPYTSDYHKRLKENDVWTIDINPKMSKFGAEKHIIGDVTNIDKYFPKDFFDIILMVGIFGFGLNIKKQAEKAMKSLYKILKKGRVLIIGWANTQEHNQINPRKLKNFKLFIPENMFGFPAHYETKNNKILEFLRKK